MREHPDALESLNLATAAGDLPGAYAALKSLDAAEANRVLLRAGFAVYGPSSCLFWSFAQQQVGEACARRLTGWELQQRQVPAVGRPS